MTAPDDTVDCIELKTTVPTARLEALQPAFWLLSPSGILTEDAGTIGAAGLNIGQCRVSIYVAPSEAEAALATLRGVLQDHGVPAEIAAREILREDWNRVWKQHYHPFMVGRRVRIEPSWEQSPDEPGIVRIAIDPGMAFGTGTHETTRLALTAVETWADAAVAEGQDLRQVRVLDAGTGSGILAILAVKLGVGHALGTEVDAVALPSAQGNLVLNGVEDRVELRLLPDPALLAPERFELVIANIISAVLVPLRDALVQRMKPGGTLILSGILWREVEEVRDHYLQTGVTLLDQAKDGEWASLTLRAPA
jgi:ribosomal protein L11 methyltransferase